MSEPRSSQLVIVLPMGVMQEGGRRPGTMPDNPGRAFTCRGTIHLPA